MNDGCNLNLYSVQKKTCIHAWSVHCDADAFIGYESYKAHPMQDKWMWLGRWFWGVQKYVGRSSLLARRTCRAYFRFLSGVSSFTQARLKLKINQTKRDIENTENCHVAMFFMVMLYFYEYFSMFNVPGLEINMPKGSNWPARASDKWFSKLLVQSSKNI